MATRAQVPQVRGHLGGVFAQAGARAHRRGQAAKWPETAPRGARERRPGRRSCASLGVRVRRGAGERAAELRARTFGVRARGVRGGKGEIARARSRRWPDCHADARRSRPRPHSPVGRPSGGPGPAAQGSPPRLVLVRVVGPGLGSSRSSRRRPARGRRVVAGPLARVGGRRRALRVDRLGSHAGPPPGGREGARGPRRAPSRRSEGALRC